MTEGASIHRAGLPCGAKASQAFVCLASSKSRHAYETGLAKRGHRIRNMSPATRARSSRERVASLMPLLRCRANQQVARVVRMQRLWRPLWAPSRRAGRRTCADITGACAHAQDVDGTRSATNGSPHTVLCKAVREPGRTKISSGCKSVLHVGAGRGRWVAASALVAGSAWAAEVAHLAWGHAHASMRGHR